MYTGPLVFTQVMDFMSLKTFQRCVERHQGNFSVKNFTCMDQFRIMAFAQLTYRESLRDIEACLRAQSNKLYHMGIRSKVSRSTLAEANEMRDWRIYADFAHHLIGIARKLYQKEPLAVELQNTVYALDARRSICACPFFPGHASEQQRGPSDFIPCWICGAISRALSTSPTESFTRSTFWIGFLWKPGLSTLWIAATRISPDSMPLPKPQRSLLSGPRQI